MCGRFVAAASDSDVMAWFHAAEALDEPTEPSWNVAPTTRVRIVVEGQDEKAGAAPRSLRRARWGLVPSWARDRSGAARLINARSETFAEKPSFRAAAARRRCLVPADGYYEWQTTTDAQGRTSKTPYFLHDPEAPILAFAGLYEFWRDQDVPDDDPEAWVCSTTILTAAATDALGHIHDRTPVILTPDLWDAWLDPSATTTDHARDVVAAAPEPRLVPREVSPAVGNIRVNHPGLVLAVGAPPAEDALF